MEPEAWSALIAVLAVSWTVWANTTEWKRGRLLKGIELIEAYCKEFDSEPFRERRKAAAIYLLNEARNNADPPADLCNILDFLEGIGFVHGKKLIEAEAVWHSFASWLLPYSVATTAVVAKLRERDPTLYEDFLSLCRAVEVIEAKRHPSNSSLHLTSPAYVKRFLKDEAR